MEDTHSSTQAVPFSKLSALFPNRLFFFFFFCGRAATSPCVVMIVGGVKASCVVGLELDECPLRHSRQADPQP